MTRLWKWDTMLNNCPKSSLQVSTLAYSPIFMIQCVLENWPCFSFRRMLCSFLISLSSKSEQEKKPENLLSRRVWSYYTNLTIQITNNGIILIKDIHYIQNFSRYIALYYALNHFIFPKLARHWIIKMLC